MFKSLAEAKQFAADKMKKICCLGRIGLSAMFTVSSRDKPRRRTRTMDRTRFTTLSRDGVYFKSATKRKNWAREKWRWLLQDKIMASAIAANSNW